MLIVVSGYCWKSVLQWLLCAHVPVVYVKKIFCQRYIIVLFHIPIINKKICWHVNSTEWMNMMCSFLQDFKKRSRATNRHQNQNQKRSWWDFTLVLCCHTGNVCSSLQFSKFLLNPPVTLFRCVTVLWTGTVASENALSRIDAFSL